MAKGKREERKKLCPLSSPVPAPLAQSSCTCQGWRVPGRQAVMLEGSAAWKAMSAPGLGTRLQTGWKGPRPVPPPLSSARPAASCCPYPGAGAGSPLLSPVLGEAVLGPAPSPEQHSGSAVLPASATPTADGLGKQDPGIDQGAITGPSPAQPTRAPHLLVCSGLGTHTSWGSGGELLSWGALFSSQATLGRLGGLSVILQDGGKG